MSAENQPYDTRLGFDNANNIWLVYISKQSIYSCHIDPQGDAQIQDLNTYTLKEWGTVNISSHFLVVDRWNNAYFTFNTSLYEDVTSIPPSRQHLVRVTPEGSVKDFFPWPELSPYTNPYLEVLHGDTLYMLGEYKLTFNCVQVRMHLTKTGAEPVEEIIRGYAALPYSLTQLTKDNTALVQWDKGWSLGVSQGSNPTTNEELEGIWIGRQQLIYHDDSMHTRVGGYPWRDYVWRTYRNTWVPAISLAHYKNEGFVLVLPDPKDPSTAHMLRLNPSGEPISPSELDDGGNRIPKHLEKLPPEFKKYADLNWKLVFNENIGRYVNDSARVCFWGLDTEGNLYAYSKVRTY